MPVQPAEQGTLLLGQKLGGNCAKERGVVYASLAKVVDARGEAPRVGGLDDGGVAEAVKKVLPEGGVGDVELGAADEKLLELLFGEGIGWSEGWGKL